MRCRNGWFALALGIVACGGEGAAPVEPANDSTPPLVATVAIPPNYGIHDTYVRDGLAFVSAWNTGIMIFDVGNGMNGGTPAAPVLVSTTATNGGASHSSWWFHNPVAHETRYLFVSQEGPGQLGVSSSGDLQVLDVSDLAHPQQVAFFHMDGAGPHNLWMDEDAQRLYVAYYNAGVVSLDVSGALSGDLSTRGIDTLAPGGAKDTYAWGVQLVNGALYVTDMMSGLWQLSTVAGHLAAVSGGSNVPERWSSDFWLGAGHAYSGTWGFAPRTADGFGNAVKVWSLDSTGALSIVDSVITREIATVSDVEVSADGKLLMFSAEGGPGSGFYFYSLADPSHPTFRARYLVASGVHTATFGYIGGRAYAFGAQDPPAPQLIILDVTSLDR